MRFALTAKTCFCVLRAVCPCGPQQKLASKRSVGPRPDHFQHLAMSLLGVFRTLSERPSPMCTRCREKVAVSLTQRGTVCAVSSYVVGCRRVETELASEQSSFYKCRASIKTSGVPRAPWGHSWTNRFVNLGAFSPLGVPRSADPRRAALACEG